MVLLFRTLLDHELPSATLLVFPAIRKHFRQETISISHILCKHDLERNAKLYAYTTGITDTSRSIQHCATKSKYIIMISVHNRLHSSSDISTWSMHHQQHHHQIQDISLSSIATHLIGVPMSVMRLLPP